MQQSLRPREVMVVDDGSDDDTENIIRSQFPEVSYIKQTHQGVSNARNTGIQNSKGEWIAFLDSDDEWRRTKLERQWNALQKQAEHKLCHCDEIWMRNGVRINQKKRHTKAGGWNFQNCLALCVISPSAVLMHGSVFDRVGLFDESLPVCEDYDLWLRICAVYPVLFVPEQLVIKRGGHADQLSRRYWGMDRFRIQALQKIIISDNLSADDRRAAIAMIVHKIRVYMSGAQKRGKHQEVREYQAMLEFYQGIAATRIRGLSDTDEARSQDRALAV